MTSKYVYANIRVPIKVSEDLSVFDILNEHMTIDFEACSALESPPDSNLINKLMSLGDLIGITKNLLPDDETIYSKNVRKRENLTFRKMPSKPKTTTTQTRRVIR